MLLPHLKDFIEKMTNVLNEHYMYKENLGRNALNYKCRLYIHYIRTSIKDVGMRKDKL
jgi:hypothetical protein